MKFFQFFTRSRTSATAGQAKDRLQILLAHERAGAAHSALLGDLQRDILAVIERRMGIGRDKVDIKLGRSSDLSTVEINIELADAPMAATLAAS